MKKLLKVVTAGLLAVSLSGCFWGEKVEVPPAHVGKIMTKNGYKQGVISTSKFRLEQCWTYCDKLVILSVADQSYTENMDLFMPKDKLNMKFDLRLTLTPNPKQYDGLFDRVPASHGVIPSNTIYTTYAQQIIRSEAREILSEYSIAEVASNLQTINSILTQKLTTSIQDKTPYMVRHIGLAGVYYPEVITKAQEAAAERREQIQQEEAKLETSRVKLERQLQEQQMQRKIDVEKAQAEAQVQKILSNTVTPAYERYHQIQIMYKMAESDNKMIIPSEMLQSLSGQVLLGNNASK